MRSRNYAGTIYLSDPLYDEKVDAIRLIVRQHNEKSKGTTQKQHRVFFRGRLGANNEHSHLYRKGGSLNRYMYRGHDIKPQHAERFDIYVYTR